MNSINETNAVINYKKQLIKQFDEILALFDGISEHDLSAVDRMYIEGIKECKAIVLTNRA